MWVCVCVHVCSGLGRDAIGPRCLRDSGPLNPWSPGGSFMVQKMAITSPIPSFFGLKSTTLSILLVNISSPGPV